METKKNIDEIVLTGAKNKKLYFEIKNFNSIYKNIEIFQKDKESNGAKTPY